MAPIMPTKQDPGTLNILKWQCLSITVRESSLFMGMTGSDKKWLGH